MRDPKKKRKKENGPEQGRSKDFAGEKLAILCRFNCEQGRRDML